jgi:hypothetical protein
MKSDPRRAVTLLLLDTAVPLTTLAILFIVMPAPPLSVNDEVSAIDAMVLIAGSAALIAIPPIVLRSGWLALTGLVTIPVYLVVVLVGWFFVPFGWAWVRCMHAPVIEVGTYTYIVPGDPGYGPTIADSYVCKAEKPPGTP